MSHRRTIYGICAVGGVAVLAASTVYFASGGGSSHIGSRDASPAMKLAADPVGAVRGAGGATRKAGTAAVETIVTMTTAATPAKGADAAMPSATTTMRGSGAFDFGHGVGQVDLTVSGGVIQEVLTPSVLYMRPASGQTVEDFESWSKVRIDSVPDGNLVSGGSTGPAMTLAMLGGALPDVKYVGDDTVRETPVAHYRGTLDLAKAASALASAGDANAVAEKKALNTAAHAFLTSVVPFDAYLDQQGRLRRFVARFAYTDSSHTKLDTTSTTDLYSFGALVSVHVPTAPKVPALASTPTMQSTSAADTGL